MGDLPGGVFLYDIQGVLPDGRPTLHRSKPISLRLTPFTFGGGLVLLALGADTSWGRTGIAAKMQYSFGTPITRSKRRRLPNAMPQGQHTPRRPVCATVVRCTRRRQHPVGLGPRCVALNPRPRDAPR